MATAEETLLTAEEYARLPDDGRPTELVRGRIVSLNPPYPYHGYVCVKIIHVLNNYVQENDLGRVLSNDSGVITERRPDTVRGADVCFYSYSRVPKGAFPRGGYLTAVPELVFEVRSPSDRLPDIYLKIGEYLRVGVTYVCVLDPRTETLTVYHAEELQRVLTADDDFALPDLLPGFQITVGRFFE
jgi:Uma2 family endonuclease